MLDRKEASELAREMALHKEQTLHRQAAERFLQFDQQRMIDLFELPHDDETMQITFLGKTYTIMRATGDVLREDGPANEDETASIFELLTKSEHAPSPTGRWESIASLCTNTTDTSLKRYVEYLAPFHGRLDLMRESLLRLGAEPSSKGDVSGILEVFKNVPVWFQYWEADDEFPASVQFLFDAGITDHFRWSLLWNVMTCITSRMKEEAGL